MAFSVFLVERPEREFGCCFFVEEVGFVQLFVCGNLNFGSVFSAGSKPRFVNGDTLFKKLN